jgi:hypothetical protein
MNEAIFKKLTLKKEKDRNISKEKTPPWGNGGATKKLKGYEFNIFLPFFPSQGVFLLHILFLVLS